MPRFEHFSLKDAIDPNHRASAELGLRDLMRQIEGNQYHLRVVKAILTDELAGHCTYTQLNESVLTVFVDSNVWATRLRFEIGRLQKTLMDLPDYAHLETILIRISKFSKDA